MTEEQKHRLLRSLKESPKYLDMGRTPVWAIEAAWEMEKEGLIVEDPEGKLQLTEAGEKVLEELPPVLIEYNNPSEAKIKKFTSNEPWPNNDCSNNTLLKYLKRTDEIERVQFTDEKGIGDGLIIFFKTSDNGSNEARY